MAAIGMISVVVVVVCVCLLVGWRGVRGDGGGVVLWGWRGVGCEGWGCDGDGMIRNLHWKHFCKKKKKEFPKPQNDAALPLKTSCHDQPPALSIQHLFPECNDTKAPP